jgi:hypothetical protein
MAAELRKKSPRAPSIDLQEAIDAALKIYEKERRHPAPTEVVAQDIGYKNANNGKALAVLASLRYFGLVEKPSDGHLAVTKSVEEYKFAPSEAMRSDLQLRWVQSPQIFSELLAKYPTGLPSDANVRFDLIGRGFSPESADSVLLVFKRSVEFAQYFSQTERRAVDSDQDELPGTQDGFSPQFLAPPSSTQVQRPSVTTQQPFDQRQSAEDDRGCDRIPVRLAGGRRAWLLIPSPFYEADKLRLKQQIDFLLADVEKPTE